MKRSLLFIFLLLTLSMGLVSSVDVDIKDSVKKGENFIVKVSGKFHIPLSKDSIKFIKKESTSKPEFGITKMERIEGSSYFYLTVPENRDAGNYSMIFEDAQYYSGSSIVTGDIVTDFEILDETVPFSISPPLIISTDKYTITIQNLMSTSIDIDLEKKDKIIPIEDIAVEEDSPGFFDLLFGGFSEEEAPNETIEIIIEEEKEVSHITLESGELRELEYLAPPFIGFETLSLYYDGEGYGVLVYNPEGRELTDEEKIEKEVIVINQTTGEVIENDTALNETIANETIVQNESVDENLGTIESCPDKGGQTCVTGEICRTETVISRDGQCCLSECTAVKESSSGKVIGWLIIGVIALFLTWFFKNKYKKSQPGKVDLIERSMPKNI